MGNQDEQPRKIRSVVSTFNLRDVAVVAVAAFTAAGPFFAYDTRISVVESENRTLKEEVAELREAIRDLSRDQYTHAHAEAQREAAEHQVPVTEPQKKGR